MSNSRLALHGLAPPLPNSFVPGTNPLCPRDKPKFFLSFDTMEAQFVPGTSPVCPWDNLGDEGCQKKFTC